VQGAVDGGQFGAPRRRRIHAADMSTRSMLSMRLPILPTATTNDSAGSIYHFTLEKDPEAHVFRSTDQAARDDGIRLAAGADAPRPAHRYPVARRCVRAGLDPVLPTPRRRPRRCRALPALPGRRRLLRAGHQPYARLLSGPARQGDLRDPSRRLAAGRRAFLRPPLSPGGDCRRFRGHHRDQRQDHHGQIPGSHAPGPWSAGPHGGHPRGLPER